MKLSAKLEYTLKTCLELARQQLSQHVLTLTDLANRQNVPRSFLVQILGALKKEGLIVSVRGTDGGYYLSRKAEQISLAEIIAAVDEKLFAPFHANAKHAENAALEEVWNEANQQLEEYFKLLTLQDLLNKADGGKPFVYSI